MEHRVQGQVLSSNVKIHYYRAGDASKPPLILVHGFGDSGLCWHRTTHALEEDYDILMT